MGQRTHYKCCCVRHRSIFPLHQPLSIAGGRRSIATDVEQRIFPWLMVEVRDQEAMPSTPFDKLHRLNPQSVLTGPPDILLPPSPMDEGMRPRVLNTFLLLRPLPEALVDLTRLPPNLC
jgi:hypothetical protein